MEGGDGVLVDCQSAETWTLADGKMKAKPSGFGFSSDGVQEVSPNHVGSWQYCEPMGCNRFQPSGSAPQQPCAKEERTHGSPGGPILSS